MAVSDQGEEQEQGGQQEELDYRHSDEDVEMGHAVLPADDHVGA